MSPVTEPKQFEEGDKVIVKNGTEEGNDGIVVEVAGRNVRVDLDEAENHIPNEIWFRDYNLETADMCEKQFKQQTKHEFMAVEKDVEVKEFGDGDVIIRADTPKDYPTPPMSLPREDAKTLYEELGEIFE